MPEVGRVLDAARLVVDALPGFTGRTSAIEALRETLAALDAKLETIGGPPTLVEQDRTWGDVVAGDQIQSAKTKGWFEVHTTVRTTEGKAKILIKGVSKPIIRDPKDPVRLRRGVEGEAVDIVEVLFSGTTTRTQAPVTKDSGPMLTDKVEDDDE